MAKDDDLPAISQETIEMIESQVKKGKARKFLLIFKGASIKTLVVFKKGPFGPKVMKAKKDGFKGEVAYGVVTGSGKNLFFQLAGNDEVAAAMKLDAVAEKPPTKKAKLREFLMANGLAFKPTYHIVTDLAAAIDPDNETDVPVPPPPAGSEVGDDDEDDTQAEAEVQAATDAGKLDQQFIAKLKGMKADLAKVMAAEVSVSQAVKAKANEASVCARQKEFAAGLEILDELESLLQTGLAEISASAPANDAASEGLLASFKARVATIVPKVKAAAGTAGGDSAKLRVSEAAVQARKNDFRRANSLLDEAERLLAKPPATAEQQPQAETTTAESPTAAMANWQMARTQAVNQLKAVAKAIANEKHTQSAAAIIELKAVIANLTVAPSTERQVAELERYLTQDDVVSDVCELADDIRTPLLRALEEMKPQLAG